MRFVIRDDDTNFFTHPEVLERAFGDLWERAPVSLAVVPFHGGAVSGAIPREKWGSVGRHPLDRNAALVASLKRWLRRGVISIQLHGFDHVERSGRPEFDSDLPREGCRKRISYGRTYLEGLLETPVGVFVPPHNALSRAALGALELEGMDALGCFSFRPWRRPLTLRALMAMARRRIFLSRQGGPGGASGFYPFPVRLDRHAEMACHNLNLDPACSPADLMRRLERTDAVGGDFCVAVHHWELAAPQLRSALRDLVEEAARRSARFVHARELFERFAAPAARRRAA